MFKLMEKLKAIFDPEDMKVCNRCHKKKASYNFYTNKRKTYVGLRPECKECTKAAQRNRYEEE